MHVAVIPFNPLLLNFNRRQACLRHQVKAIVSINRCNNIFIALKVILTNFLQHTKNFQFELTEAYSENQQLLLWLYYDNILRNLLFISATRDKLIKDNVIF